MLQFHAPFHALLNERLVCGCWKTFWAYGIVMPCDDFHRFFLFESAACSLCLCFARIIASPGLVWISLFFVGVVFKFFHGNLKISSFFSRRLFFSCAVSHRDVCMHAFRSVYARHSFFKFVFLFIIGIQSSVSSSFASFSKFQSATLITVRASLRSAIACGNIAHRSGLAALGLR